MDGNPVAYLDGPGGTQVPDSVITAMGEVLSAGVSNLGGPFDRSRYAADITRTARSAMMDFFAGSDGDVVFGPNMTTLTFAVSRAIAATWNAGDNVVVTNLDHDANVTPWTVAAAERDVEVRVADIDPDTTALDLSSLESAIDQNTRLVAVCAASNAVGTVVPVERVSALARPAGALVYVDAVHYSAHRLPRPQEWDVDFAVCSPYKFFGPHAGVLWGRKDRLAELDPYKVVPAPDRVPDRWETGTASFEAMAGVTAAVDYLADLGEGDDRVERLESGFAAIRAHEETLAGRFLGGVAEIPHVSLHGPGGDGPDRVATFAVSVAGRDPREVTRYLGESGIYAWDGHYYAIAVMRRLGLLDSGGATRIGFVHYSTAEEVDRVLGALAGLS